MAEPSHGTLFADLLAAARAAAVAVLGKVKAVAAYSALSPSKPPLAGTCFSFDRSVVANRTNASNNLTEGDRDDCDDIDDID